MNLYGVDGPWRGMLAILPRPRGGDWLADDTREWKDTGLDVIVSLLDENEVQELGLSNEAALTRAQGLSFYSFQIPDLGVPPSLTNAQKFLDMLSRELADGKRIGIHCRQGIGRSGLIAAGLLCLAGFDPEAAVRRVSKARGLSIPETPEQTAWIMRFARECSSPVASR